MVQLLQRIGPLKNNDIEKAILEFSALSLPEKIEAIASAAIKTEELVTHWKGKIGHPGEFPWDYKNLIARNMLGSGVRQYDGPEALLALGYNGAKLLNRAQISVHKSENVMLGHLDALVMASAEPKNDFIAIIGGFWLNRGRPFRLIDAYTIDK